MKTLLALFLFAGQAWAQTIGQMASVGVGSVGTASLTDGSVDTAKLKSGSVTVTKFQPAANGVSGVVMQDSSGRVGVGTVTPSKLLTIETTGTGSQSLGTFTVPNAVGNNATLDFSVNASGTIVPVAQIVSTYTASGTVGLSFNTFASSALRNSVMITGAGLVGVGTSVPCSTCALHVVGNINAIGQLRQNDTVSCTLGLKSDADGVITGCVASDIALKERINALPYTATVDELRPVTYEWKNKKHEDAGLHAGFIAQDVEKVFPRAVVAAGNGMKGVDPNALISVLVKEIQELRKRVAVLEKK